MVDSFEGVNDHFTSLEQMGTHGHNRLARAKRYGRWYLLKGLGDEEAPQQAYHEMLAKEFDIMMRLQHPGVAQAVGLEDVPSMGKCIVMEWVEGVTLARWLKTGPSRDTRRDVARQLMEALAHIHRQGVVHRDIKPSNIMVTTDGQVKIIDFGLADTHAHATLKQAGGTTGYMAPEQAAGTMPDPRNDIYSLGLVLEEMQLGSLYRRPIARCLQPIAKRYSSVEELMSDLQRRRTRRHYAAIAAFAVGLSLIVAAIMLGIGYYGKKKLESPSGQYRFEHDDFAYTNWTGGSTNCVSAQYVGEGAPHLVVRYSVAENSNIWIVEELGFGCFRDVTKMESLTIEASHFAIQKHAFTGCTNLKEISMPRITKVPSIGNGGWQTVIDSVFEPYHYEQVTLYVPDVEMMRADTSWCRFKHIEKYKNNE